MAVDERGGVPSSMSSFAEKDPEQNSQPNSSHGEENANEAQSDPVVVDWDGPDDPEKPVNWPQSKKMVNLTLIWIFTFLSPLASSMYASAMSQVMVTFNNDSVYYATWTLSVYVLGYAFGPLFIAPMSEVWGRLPVYHVANTLFVVFIVACAVADTYPMLAGFRFMAGVAGSGPITLGAGSIGDLVRPERRGIAIAIWSLGPCVGPAIAPVCGGFIAEAKGWRWLFWVIAIVSGFFLLVSFPLMSETYSHELLRRKARRLRKEGHNVSVAGSGPGIVKVVATAIARPIQMLIFSPICLSLSLYTTFVYGIYYIFLTTMIDVFETEYGFSPQIVGLSYIGLGIGAGMSTLACGQFSDMIVKRMTAKHGVRKPEFRLPPMIPGSLFTPIGLFWFGWSVKAHVHWIVPIIGTWFIGAGLAASFMPLSYLVDAYHKYAASAIAANTIIRSVGGAILPLAGPQLYKSLGQGWGNSLLGFISMLIIPLTIFLYKYGEQLRLRSTFLSET